MGCFIGLKLFDHLGPNRKVHIERSDTQAANVTPMLQDKEDNQYICLIL